MTERDIDRHETEVFTQIEGSEDYPEGVEEPPLTAEDVQNQETSRQDVQKPEESVRYTIRAGYRSSCKAGRTAD